ncbi:hypothetical protein SD70_15825 [Gordoniibacillus kamchatkensis]|uniref:Uncharacterized protein n=1 Tax=Gordoniibacillus kamchatkensis TaxID=1590651 RepID=A0ABR5AGG2_9BACL|nr:hypothetical protein [Paenibacillus sp. VKM B-2647]KIL40138.1 hypothetical protein SD70_15825 [Paenibacillus sp. VKM B-2647]
MPFSVFYRDRQLSPVKNTLDDAEEWMAKFSAIFLNMEIRQVGQPATYGKAPPLPALKPLSAMKSSPH